MEAREDALLYIPYFLLIHHLLYPLHPVRRIPKLPHSPAYY